MNTNPTQVIAEAYHMMKDNLGMNAGEIGKVMEGWNKTELDSYLMEISANILQVIIIIFFVLSCSLRRQTTGCCQLNFSWGGQMTRKHFIPRGKSLKHLAYEISHFQRGFLA